MTCTLLAISCSIGDSRGQRESSDDQDVIQLERWHLRRRSSMFSESRNWHSLKYPLQEEELQSLELKTQLFTQTEELYSHRAQSCSLLKSVGITCLILYSSSCRWCRSSKSNQPKPLRHSHRGRIPESPKPLSAATTNLSVTW